MNSILLPKATTILGSHFDFYTMSFFWSTVNIFWLSKCGRCSSLTVFVVKIHYIIYGSKILVWDNRNALILVTSFMHDSFLRLPIQMKRCNLRPRRCQVRPGLSLHTSGRSSRASSDDKSPCRVDTRSGWILVETED